MINGSINLLNNEVIKINDDQIEISNIKNEMTLSKNNQIIWTKAKKVPETLHLISLAAGIYDNHYKMIYVNTLTSGDESGSIFPALSTGCNCIRDGN